MNKLDPHDLRFSVLRLPSKLRKLMMEDSWKNEIFVGGGFIRSVVSNEKINDIDLFTTKKEKAELLSLKLSKDKTDIYRTPNAYTIKSTKPVIQIIDRWFFELPSDVSNSFDFTVCCAVIYWNGKEFDSYCDERFYTDLAGKRIVYRNPIRNEDAGGSMLRVLKYYQKGFRIPLDSLADVITRLIIDIDFKRCGKDKESISRVILGLLREVDPATDPTHAAHLPSTRKEDDQNNDEIIFEED